MARVSKIIFLSTLVVGSASTQTVNWGLSAEEEVALESWLDCNDCDGADAVALRLKKFGPSLVPPLKSALFGGLSPQVKKIEEEALRKAYQELREYATSRNEPGPSSTEEQYGTFFLSNMDALYRAQAARGLGMVGGTEAKRTLREAFSKENIREDVKDIVQSVLCGMK